MTNFALLGCGRIAKRHAELLKSGAIRGAKLTAVCDIQPDRAARFGKEFDVPNFTDMHKMMKELGHQVDVVSILTESGNHAAHCLELAPYRKHLVVEKPMALTLEDADEMIRVCDLNNIKLFVVKQNRCNVPVVKLKHAVTSGRFGKLVLGTTRVRWCREQKYYDQDKWRGTWALDGGVFANQASHHIDLLQWLMGDVESVFSMASTRLANIEAEDTGIATLKFKNGALGIIEATTATRPLDLEGSLSVLGENGTAEIGGFAVNQMKVWNFKESTPEDQLVLQKYRENPPNVYGFGHKTYLQHVVDSIVDNKPSLVDGLEGRRSLELITALYESIETGREVRLRFKAEKCRLGAK
jgi:predicted dehydrogenase